MTARHVLGLSGGKDSAALAVHMRQNHPELDIEYFFTDTGQELPEVHEFLNKLEGFLGKSILRLNPEKKFDYWLKQYGNFLPSPQTRWCTRQLKIKPFLDWIKPITESGIEVFSYVAIRADENAREGLKSPNEKIIVRMPFRELGIDKAGVHDLLESAGLGLPSYYEWRSRSGCTFCFYQQKIEWVRLLERHPEDFHHAQSLEKTTLEAGSKFTWTQGESLEELRTPERVAAIREDHRKRVERVKQRKNANPLRTISLEEIDNDEIYGAANKFCVMCHK